MVWSHASEGHLWRHALALLTSLQSLTGLFQVLDVAYGFDFAQFFVADPRLARRSWGVADHLNDALHGGRDWSRHVAGCGRCDDTLEPEVMTQLGHRIGEGHGRLGIPGGPSWRDGEALGVPRRLSSRSGSAFSAISADGSAGDRGLKSGRTGRGVARLSCRNCDARERHRRQHALGGRPHPAFAAPEPGQADQDALPRGLVGLPLDSAIYGGPVLV